MKYSLFRLLLLAALPGLAMACSPAQEAAEYQRATSYYQNEELADEERSTAYQLTYNTDSNEFVFDRTYFKVSFQVFPDRAYNFGLTLVNKTDSPITIDWNRASYVDLKGMPHSVIHQGIHYEAPVRSQTPTVVPPEGTLTDLLRPADRKEINGVMRLAKLTKPANTPTDFSAQVTLVMPMKVLGQIQQYTFALPLGGWLDDWPERTELDPWWWY